MPPIFSDLNSYSNLLTDLLFLLILCLQLVLQELCLNISEIGTSLAWQRQRLCTSNTGGMGLIPGWGIKIPHAAWHIQNKQTSGKKAPKTHKNISEIAYLSVTLRKA